MNTDTSGFELVLDQALRDLVELERQVCAGELSASDAARLRRHYESQAAAAIRALDAVRTGGGQAAGTGEAAIGEPEAGSGGAEGDPGGPRTTDPRRRVLPGKVSARSGLYALGAAAAVTAALLLPGNVLGRPPGGYVSGNEALQGPTGTALPRPASPPRDLSKVTDRQLEAVVAANPQVVGMRLALAARYVDKGRYDLASVHYVKALQQDPDNVEAKAHLGWLMMQLDRPKQAALLVDQALAAQPGLLDAMWFRANIRLYGLDDPEGALRVLDALRNRTDLTAEVRRQVEDLRRTASARAGGSGR